MQRREREDPDRLHQEMQQRGAEIWRQEATPDEQIAADVAREAGWTQVAAINPAVVLSPCGQVRVSIGRKGGLRSLERDRGALPTSVPLPSLLTREGWAELLKSEGKNS